MYANLFSMLKPHETAGTHRHSRDCEKNDTRRMCSGKEGTIAGIVRCTVIPRCSRIVKKRGVVFW